MEGSWFVDALVSVCAKIVSLRLDEVGGHAFAPVSVEVAERGHQTCYGIAHVDGMDDDVAHVLFFCRQQLADVSIQQDIGQVGVFGEGLVEYFEEGRADDTAASPNPYYFRQGDLHIQLGGCFVKHGQTLSVADDGGEEKRVLHLLYKHLLWDGDVHD